MKVKSRQGITALALAVSSAAVLGAGSMARATTGDFTTSTQVDSLIENPTNFGGTSRVSAEGTLSGAAPSFWDYALLDFNTSALLPAQTNISSSTDINSITLSLVDKAEGFAVAGVVDIYLTTNSNPSSSFTYQSTLGVQGFGPTTLATLYTIGQVNYTKTLGAVSNITLNLAGNTALQSYLQGQINTGATIRMVIADDTATTAADYEGSAGQTGTPTLAPPALSLNLTTTTVAAKDVVFNISAGANTTVTGTPTNKAISITIPRIVTTGSSVSNITVTNTGTSAGNYTLVNSVGTATTAGGSSKIGTEPVAALTGTSTITVGISPSTIMPGNTQDPSLGGIGPVSATVTIRNHDNAADADAVVTVTANQVVATRIVNSAGASATPVTFGRVLSGTTTASKVVTLDTENTGTFDFTSASLTTIDLLATAVNANQSLTSSVAGTSDKAAVAAGTGNVTFDGGGTGITYANNSPSVASTTRNVTFTAGAVGGLYQTSAFFDGYVTLVMGKDSTETAVGAGNTTARVYVEADVFQPALVALTTSGNTFSLSNTKHTTNTASSTLGDIGARSNATVTAVTLTGQTGFTSGAVSVGTVLVDNSGNTTNPSTVAATFDPTAKWNGVYQGNVTVTLQNDQTILGAAPNDIGNKTFALSATVLGNSGNASVNVLAGQSFAGYSIPRGTGKNSTVSLLGGVSTAGTTVSATWANGTSASALSDQVTLNKAGNDLFVVQMTYDPTAITGGLTNSPELSYVNGSNISVLATFGNSDGGTSANETIGAFSGTPTLGQYGVNPANNTVWAVVDHVGSFEAFQRKLGDATGDGTVDLNDLNTVLNNLGVTTALWSHGNFDGAAAIDLNDLNAVLNNLGTSLPQGANSVAVAETLLEGFTPSAVPEPTTLGIAGVGIAGLLLRRKNRTQR